MYIVYFVDYVTTGLFSTNTLINSIRFYYTVPFRPYIMK